MNMVKQWKPFLSSWLRLKEEAFNMAGTDAIVFCELGPYCEAYFDDAMIVADSLGLPLALSQIGEVQLPIVAIPLEELRSFTRTLAWEGFNVVLAGRPEGR